MANTAVRAHEKTVRKNRTAYAAPPTGAVCAVMEEPLAYVVSCPVCEKRVFDISELPPTPIHVRLKCPHCRRVIQIPCAAP